MIGQFYVKGITVDLNKREVEAYETVDKVLETIAKLTDCDEVYISETSGEIIDMSEIARVRGILSAFFEMQGQFLLHDN